MTIGTTRPGLSAAFLSPYVPIGYTRSGLPVYPAQGARSGSNVEFIVDDSDDDSDPFADRDGDDDDDDDDEDDDEDQDDDQEDDEPQDRKRRPQKRTQRRDSREEGEESDGGHERMADALKRANATAARYRRAGKAMEKLGIDDLPSFLLDRGIDPETGRAIQGDDEVDDEAGDAVDGDQAAEAKRNGRRGRTQAEIVADLKRAEARGEARAGSKYEAAVIEFATEAALRGAGWKGKNLAMAIRLVDNRAIEVEFDQSGSPVVYGLDEQVEGIKGEFPDWFASEEEPEPETRRPQRRAPRRAGAREVDGGDRGRQKPRPATWLDQLDQRIASGR